MMLHQNFKQINMKDFFVAAEFPKTPSPKPARIPPQTPPAGGKSAEAKRKILPPRKKDFRFAESVLKPHALPEYLEGRTPKEKHPFLFQKKFHPRQIRNARSVFLSGLPRLCEAVAERYERTRQFRATTRSARAISRHQGCFQNTFELCLIHTAKFAIISSCQFKI